MTELSARDTLIAKLQTKSLRQSYSKLKNLDSPINYMNAILKPKAQNAGMQLGSIVDCLLLTEDEFDDRFTITDAIPTTDKQEEFCKAVIAKLGTEIVRDEIFEAVWHEVVLDGFGRLKTDQLKDFVRASALGKACISLDDLAKAKNIVSNLKSSAEVMDELAEMDKLQYRIDFQYKGWDFIGFLDAANGKGFTDLKFSSDCEPEKYGRNTIEKFGYDIQVGIYAIAYELLYNVTAPRITHIVYDEIGNHVVLEFDSGYVEWCKRKVDFRIACLEKMIRENAFDRSYNFFRKNRTIYKPKWAPGFDMSLFDFDLDDIANEKPQPRPSLL